MTKYPGVCPRNNELELYSGCSFGCVYCIAKSRHSVNPEPLSDPGPILAQINHASDSPFYLSPWTDPYQPLESRAKLAAAALKALSSRRRPFFVITRSTLVRRDLNHFAGNPAAFIAISLNTLDDAITHILEPAAPSASERKALIQELAASGRVRTVVKIDPILPGITDGNKLEELAAWLCRVKPAAVTIETARLTSLLARDLGAALGEKCQGELLKSYPALSDQPLHPFKSYRLPLFRTLAATFTRHGVRASFCKASLPFPITPYDCRGGY